VNLGNPEEIPVFKVAEHVIALIGSRSHMVFLPLPQDDPMRRKPDIAEANKLLGWQPSTRLDDGLPRTIEHFRSRVPGNKGRQATRRGKSAIPVAMTAKQ
jgi:UDP-glucuronate decarboxylase